MLTCAMSLFSGDAQLARKLLLWIERLSNVKAYELLLVCDAGTPFDVATELMMIGNRVFKETHVTTTPAPVAGWPLGCNANWFAAMKWGAMKKRDLLFLETDAIALKPTWLDELNAAWEAAPEDTNYLGNIEACAQLHLPPKVISGVGIYSHRVGEYALVDTGQPWNVGYADLLIPHGVHSPLIKDFFGQKDLPPIFVKERNEHSPANALTLDFIPKEAVLWHRDKSHSLIPILRRKLFNEDTPVTREKIAVVVPVHNGDVQLAIRHAQWLTTLGKWNHKAIISHDQTCSSAAVVQLFKLLSQCFEVVEMHRYPAPPIKQYPHVANWCWQAVATRMSSQAHPWLFMEPDMCVLRADWLDVLQDEYERAGAAWMGPHVKGMRHANGAMVYPHDAARRMPRAMHCGAEAFDTAAAADIMHDCHDCDHLLFHTWSVMNGEWCPVGGGQLPVGVTLELANKIPKSAVAIHRVKCASLINLLAGGWRP